MDRDSNGQEGTKCPCLPPIPRWLLGQQRCDPAEAGRPRPCLGRVPRLRCVLRWVTGHPGAAGTLRELRLLVGLSLSQLLCMIFTLKDRPGWCLCSVCCVQLLPRLEPARVPPAPCPALCHGGGCSPSPGSGAASRPQGGRLQTTGLCRLYTSLCLHKGVSWNYFGHLLAWSSASLAKPVFFK